MLWLGWVEAGARWRRSSAKAIEEAARMVASLPALAPHCRGFISASTTQQMAMELSGQECTVRLTFPCKEGASSSPAWVGVCPSVDALAAGAPDSPLPMLRIDVINLQGAPISGLLVVADGLFEPDEIFRGLRLPVESNMARPGCLPVLASDRRPTPATTTNYGALHLEGFRIFKCENPTCRAHGQDVLVQSAEHDALLKAGQCVAYPCPSCVGPWHSRWALSYVRRTTPQDATRRLAMVVYPIRPTRKRRVSTPGPMQLVERSDTGVDLAQWAMPPMPAGVRRFMRSSRMGDLVAAMRDDPVRTGNLLCGILTNENLRSLVHSTRLLPPGRRGGGIPTALAHGLFPRRTAIYKLPHAQEQAAHHQYIALDPENFLRKMIYYGVAGCTGRFLDVGCGIGEKVFLAYALGRFSRCDGIEYDPRTLAVAHFLLRQISTIDPYPIHFEQADALTFEGYGNYDVIYMFRPMHDPSFMARLFGTIARDMKVGAKVFDVFRQDCALCKIGPHELVRTRSHPRTGRAVWDVPTTLDEFALAMDLELRT